MPRRVVQARLRESLERSEDGGERRAHLVAHVGDEVASDLLEAADLGDVGEERYGATRLAVHGRDRDRQRPSVVAR